MNILNIANELNRKFNAGELDTENMNFNNVFTDDEIIDVLMHELSEPNDEPEIIYSQPAGHFDEQTLEQYLNATDEDGNWLHPYNTEDLI